MVRIQVLSLPVDISVEKNYVASRTDKLLTRSQKVQSPQDNFQFSCDFEVRYGLRKIVFGEEKQ